MPELWYLTPQFRHFVQLMKELARSLRCREKCIDKDYLQSYMQTGDEWGGVLRGFKITPGEFKLLNLT